MKDRKKRSKQRLDRAESVAGFRSESGVPLLPDDVFLEPTGIVSSGSTHRLTFRKAKSGIAVICEPYSFRRPGLIIGATAGVAGLALIGGAIAGAAFATPQVAGMLLLTAAATAGSMYAMTWFQNRTIQQHHPLLTFNSGSGVLSVKNGTTRAHRDDVLCLMLMNSRGRHGKAETTVFQLKLVLRRPQGNHHEAIVLLQNRTVPLDRYHEQLVPFAREAKIPLVECQYDFRQFHLARRV